MNFLIVDECTMNTHNCHANALCTDTKTSFTCECIAGYVGDGVTCTGKFINIFTAHFLSLSNDQCLKVYVKILMNVKHQLIIVLPWQHVQTPLVHLLVHVQQDTLAMVSLVSVSLLMLTGHAEFYYYYSF